MQFSIEKKFLLSQIQNVSKVSPVRSTMAILNSIFFEVEGNKLSLRTSDLEITMSTTFKVNGIEDGSVAVPVRVILDLVSEAEEGDINFEANEEGNITLHTGKGVFKVMGRPGEEFPSIPKVVVLNEVKIENKIFRRMIQKSIFAVSKDELKPALLGVLFHFSKKELRAVATDGHRLVRCIRKDYTSNEFDGEVIIPTKFLNLIVGYLTDDGSTSLTIGENHVKVELDSTVIYSRIIDERFPDYESVIPKDNDKTLIADINKLMSTIRRILIFSNKTTHQISFSLSKKVAKISTVDQETMSSADEEIDVDYKGGDIVLGYNGEYVKEILKNVESEKVIIKLKAPISACLVFPEEQEQNEELTMLLMPIRLTE